MKQPGWTDDPLYQNVMGDDCPLFNQYLSQVRFKAISVTPADAVMTKAKLLFQTKVVDSSPATSLCPIPVGAGGVKIFLSGNSGSVASFTRTMTQVSDSAHGNLMHSNSWNSNHATPQNASRSYRNFMSTSPNPPPECGGAAFLAEALNSCASGVMIASLIDGAAEKNMDIELVEALAADAGSPKGSKDRGARRRRILGIGGTQV